MFLCKHKEISTLKVWVIFKKSEEKAEYGKEDRALATMLGKFK